MATTNLLEMCSNLPHYLFMRLGVQFLRKDVSLRRLRLDYRQQSWAFEKVRTILLKVDRLNVRSIFLSSQTRQMLLVVFHLAALTSAVLVVLKNLPREFYVLPDKRTLSLSTFTIFKNRDHDHQKRS